MIVVYGAAQALGVQFIDSEGKEVGLEVENSQK